MTQTPFAEQKHREIFGLHEARAFKVCLPPSTVLVADFCLQTQRQSQIEARYVFVATSEGKSAFP